MSNTKNSPAAQHILLRDYETRSTLNLPDVGAWRYATHPGTDVLCCAFCIDDGPTKLWVPGDPVPPEFLEAAHDPAWIVSAFNDNFERQIDTYIMAPRYGWPTVPIDQHRCLQASALSRQAGNRSGSSRARTAKGQGRSSQHDDAGKAA